MSTPMVAKWKRIQAFLFWSIVAILALNLGWVLFKGSISRAQATGHVAYTVFRTESAFDKAGILKFTNHYVEAVQSDGSRMWRGSTDEVQQRKINFANGDEVRTNEFQSRKSTYPKVLPGPLSQRDPQASCASTEDLKAGWTAAGSDTLGGYRAARMVKGSGQRTMTAWYALDAGCALLRLYVKHETGVTDQNLAALIVGEPDPALFQTPASFQEVPPSALFDCSSPGSKCRPLPDSVKQRLDKTYYDARAKTP